VQDKLITKESLVMEAELLTLKKLLILNLIMVLCFFTPSQYYVKAKESDSIKNYKFINTNQDSTNLRLQDMLAIVLIPLIQRDVSKSYPESYGIEIEPWLVNLIQTKRVNGFRGFILTLTLEVQPSIGHHVLVGKDRLTYEISYGPEIKLLDHTHLKTYKVKLP